MIFNSRQKAFKKLLAVGEWAGVHLDEELELTHELGHINALKPTSVTLNVNAHTQVGTNERVMEVWTFSVTLHELNSGWVTPEDLFELGTDIRRKAKLIRKLNDLGFMIISKGEEN